MKENLSDIFVNNFPKFTNYNIYENAVQKFVGSLQ